MMVGVNYSLSACTASSHCYCVVIVNVCAYYTLKLSFVGNKSKFSVLDIMSASV